MSACATKQPITRRIAPALPTNAASSFAQDLNAAETHLQKALELEPDNESYLLALAQAQWAKNDKAKARKTLEAACRPSADEKIRAAAHEMLNRIDASGR